MADLGVLQPRHLFQVIPHELMNEAELLTKRLSVSGRIFVVLEVSVLPAEILDNLVRPVEKIYASIIIVYHLLFAFEGFELLVVLDELPVLLLGGRELLFEG